MKSVSACVFSTFTLVLIMYLTRKIDWFNAGQLFDKAGGKKPDAIQS